MRPNIHVADMCDLYPRSLRYDDERIDGQIFNTGYENRCVAEIATIVKAAVGEDVEIVTSPTNDNRSYHISSEKFKRELGFVANHTLTDAVCDLLNAFKAGKIPNSMTDDRYYNIKRMQRIKL